MYGVRAVEVQNGEGLSYVGPLVVVRQLRCPVHVVGLEIPVHDQQPEQDGDADAVLCAPRPCVLGALEESQTRSGGVVALAARERLQARFDRHHALFAAGAISVP